jgi:hypothetical protein
VTVRVVDGVVGIALLHAGRDADRDEVEVGDRRFDGDARAFEHSVGGAGVATRAQRRVLVEPDDDDPMVVEDDDPRPVPLPTTCSLPAFVNEPSASSFQARNRTEPFVARAT